jgi:hypothetical protein
MDVQICLLIRHIHKTCRFSTKKSTRFILNKAASLFIAFTIIFSFSLFLFESANTDTQEGGFSFGELVNEVQRG